MEQQEQVLREGSPGVGKGRGPAWSKQAPRAAGGRTPGSDRTCDLMIASAKEKSRRWAGKKRQADKGVARPLCLQGLAAAKPR